MIRPWLLLLGKGEVEVVEEADEDVDVADVFVVANVVVSNFGFFSGGRRVLPKIGLRKETNS